MRTRRLVPVALVALLGAACLASCSKREPPPPAPIAIPTAPVPAPEGLVADVYVAHPGATWTNVRSSIAGPAAFFPSQLGMLTGTLLGLPPGAMAQIDADVPALGAIFDDAGRLGAVIAMHVKDGARLVELVTTGDNARFTKKTDPSAVTLLEAKGGASPAGVAVGVAGNYLVLGLSPADIARYAPYATRTLSTRPVPADDVVAIVPRAALSGTISRRIKGAWDEWRREREADDAAMRAKHGASTPDFGDPLEAMAHVDAKSVTKLLAVLGDLDEARATLTADASNFHARLSMHPAAGNGPATQELAAAQVGDARALLDLPAICPVALLTRDSAEARTRSATDASEALAKIFGGRLPPADRSRIDGVLAAWAKGRGDWLTVGGLWTDTTRAVVVRGAASEPAVLGKALGDILRLSEIPAIGEPLRNFVGDVKLSPGAGAPAGVTAIHVTRGTPKLKPPPPKGAKPAPEDSAIDVLWSVEKSTLLAAAGKDAKGAYGVVSSTTAAQSLGGVPEIAAAVNALGSDVAFALLVAPLQLTAGVVAKGSTPQPPAPIVLSYGRTGADGWLRLDVADLLVREYLKAKGGI